MAPKPRMGHGRPVHMLVLSSTLFSHSCLFPHWLQPLTPPTTTRQHRVLCRRGVIADAVQLCPSPLQPSQTAPRHNVEVQNVHKRSLSASLLWHHRVAVSAHRVHQCFSNKLIHTEETFILAIIFYSFLKCQVVPKTAVHPIIYCKKTL